MTKLRKIEKFILVCDGKFIFECDGQGEGVLREWGEGGEGGTWEWVEVLECEEGVRTPPSSVVVTGLSSVTGSGGWILEVFGGFLGSDFLESMKTGGGLSGLS